VPQAAVHIKAPDATHGRMLGRDDMTSPAPSPRKETTPVLPGPRWLILGFLFFAALGIRLYHSTTAPLDFHATRQYRSLIIARAFYFDDLTSIPEWKKQVAECSQRKQGLLEPPIMESVVAAGYHVLGGERFWLPRILSSIFWLVGGGFLYRIGTRVADRDAALFATAFYLLLPFGIVASRSFQPDPLMVMLMLASVLAILRHDAGPSRGRLALAAALSALAFVIKPSSVFVVMATFVALAICRQGIRHALWSRSFGIFVGFTVAPALLIYWYGVVKGVFLVGEAQKTLLPGLWLSPFFWRGWLMQIGTTVGFVCFVGALLGTFGFRRGLPQALITGLWVGYVAFCLVLNYNVATHNYYQLQLIPIVALSLGPIVALAMQRAHELRPAWGWRLGIWVVWCLALALSLADARAKLANPFAERKVAIQQEIGEQVGHSRRTIFLSGDYGVPLEYNGLLCGSPWPLHSDLEWEQLTGRPVLKADDRFSRWYSKNVPEYFIVEDFPELAQQPDLERFLSRFPVLAKKRDYVIYKLRAS
jgi:hypothetical protein